MIVQDEPSKERQFVKRIHRGTLRLIFINIRNKGSDMVDGCVERTIEGTMVHHRGPLRYTWPKNEKWGVTDPHDSSSRA